ncbi:hypothetical protein F4777DRAFT_583280 [Nemania sp. FL0916]|nr:hypothetical protein F4777DRAFT_583280 [Nemania sp. FL0916]
MGLPFPPRHQYHDVSEDSGSETDQSLLEKTIAPGAFRERAKPHLKYVVISSLILNVFFLVAILTKFVSQNSKQDVFQQMYTPVQDVIEYRLQNFENPIPKVDDDFAGPPTPERNARWRALHYVGDTRLSKAQAAQIHNKTAAAQPDSDEDYPIVFTVFHDLHCLDAIRLAMGYLRDEKWNATYNPYTIPWPQNFQEGLYSPAHAHHCFNSIRQSLQCFSDVTPQVFQYHPLRNKVISNFDVTHTCRNFEAIHQWALENAYVGEFNFTGWRDEQGLCGPEGC